MTQAQLDEIDAELRRGATPEELASLRGITRAGLQHQLLRAGKRIVITRCLADTAPMPDDARPGGAARELTAA